MSQDRVRFTNSVPRTVPVGSVSIRVDDCRYCLERIVRAASSFVNLCLVSNGVVCVLSCISDIACVVESKLERECVSPPGPHTGDPGVRDGLCELPDPHRGVPGKEEGKQIYTIGTDRAPGTRVCGLCTSVFVADRALGGGGFGSLVTTTQRSDSQLKHRARTEAARLAGEKES